MAKKKTSRSKGPKCLCGPSNFWFGVLAAIILAIGTYLFVMGFVAQLNGLGTVWETLLWYALGILVMFFGKIAKFKMFSCPSHSH